MTNVELKSVSELLDKQFIVPLYQRGYRWETQQVRDLLEDIDGFIQNQETHEKKSKDEGKDKSVPAEIDDFYCLQPLAVKEAIKNKNVFLNQLPTSSNVDVLFETRKAIDNSVCWEVIDGQQRLTTIFIILQYLDTSTKEASTKRFQIQFERWGKKSDDVGENANVLSDKISNTAAQLKKDPEYQNGESIDLWHVCNAYKEIVRYFDDGQNGGFYRNSVQFKKKFRDTLLNKVQFIWYESDEDNPIKIFTRLNIGKIALTNSELIKALFLNRSNFADGDFEKIRLRQMEIATRWDEIEATLQNDEFWMFIHSPGFDKPTRIDFIFDLICEKGSLDGFLQDGFKKRIGNDKYRTFRYFNEYFHSEKARKQADENHSTLVEQCWREVDGTFAAFKEWFGDLTLYHYVGFLIARGVNVQKILEQWSPLQKKNSTKVDFISSLKKEIKEKIKDCADLGKQYEIGIGPSKTVCLPLLLLHNVQSVINQNAVETYKYGIAAFYRFPFHLFKVETWNVEHIDSNTENPLENDKDREAWLKSTYCFLSESDKMLKDDILGYFNSQKKDKNKLTDVFHVLYEKIIEKFAPVENKLDTNGKNKIGNFTLLDETTNKSYGNAIFPVKKMILMGKSRGWEFEFREIKENDKEDGKITGFEIEAHPQGKAGDGNDHKTAFVPPVTMSAFLKAFNPVASNAWTWDANDAMYYRRNIYDTLKEFGVTLPKEDLQS